jgi:hypothetical protein
LALLDVVEEQDILRGKYNHEKRACCSFINISLWVQLYMNEQCWELNHISVPWRILHHQGDVDLFVIEDMQGRQIVYTHSGLLARVCFAAPGLLNTMDRVSSLCVQLSNKMQDHELQQEASDVLEEIRTILESAIHAKIESIEI